MYATVTAYKGIIVLQLLATASNEEVTTTLDNPGVFGQVICNSATNVGISEEAIKLLKTIRPGGDSIGDVDWFRSDAKGDVFAWIGGPWAMINPETAEAARGYAVRSYATVPNDVPDGAKEVIDAA
jgi:hypothetical protein